MLDLSLKDNVGLRDFANIKRKS